MLLLAASSPPLMSDRDVGKKHVNSTYVNVNKQEKKATYAAVKPTARLAATAGGKAYIACRHFPTVGGLVPVDYNGTMGSTRRVFRKGPRKERLSLEASFRTSTCLKGPGDRSDAAAPQNRKLFATKGGLCGGVGVAFTSRRIYLR